MTEKIDIVAEEARLAMLAAVQIEFARQRAGLTHTALAEKLGVSEERVEEILDGQADMSFQLLAECGLACGAHFVIEPLNVVMPLRMRFCPSCLISMNREIPSWPNRGHKPECVWIGKNPINEELS